MAYERMEHMAGMIGARTSTVTDAVQDVAAAAGSYVQHQAARAAHRAQDLAHEADERVAKYTGRSLEGWAADARDFVRKHPVQLLAATIGVGYVLGKVMQR